MRVTEISNPEALLDYLPEWESLGAMALEPNPFYEPWMLLPALRSFGPKLDIRLLLVFDDGTPGKLCGVFPMERQPRYMGLPFAAWRLWKHPHCYLTVPLIREDNARECLQLVLDWLRENGNCRFLEWKHAPGEGPFHKLLTDRLRHDDCFPVLWESFTRAFLQPMRDGDQYLNSAMSGKSRSSLRRKAKLLSENGRVEYSFLQSSDPVDAWIESFIRLEASGWKGQEGSAIGCQPAHREFFVAAATGAFERNRMLMPSMLLDGKPIAQNCYFTAGRGVFFFKPAFNEDYARFSPGLLLECENIRHVHRAGLDWMDSCTSHDNDMYNRLLLNRRAIQTLIIPLKDGFSSVVASGFPLIRSIKHMMLKARASSRPQASQAKEAASEA